MLTFTFKGEVQFNLQKWKGHCFCSRYTGCLQSKLTILKFYKIINSFDIDTFNLQFCKETLEIY